MRGRRWALTSAVLLAACLVGGVDLWGYDGTTWVQLLARTGLADVVDAALVLLASDDDLILTSDVCDLKVLASRTHVELVPV